MKSFGKVMSLLLVVLAFVAVLHPGEVDAQDEEPLRVGFVYVGPVGDFGWTYAHDQGRQGMVEKLGDRVQTTKVEAVPPPDVSGVLESLIAQDHDLLFAVSLGFQKPAFDVAKRNPDVNIMVPGAWLKSENFGNYYAKFYQASYLAGIAAGELTESNTLGYVAPHPVPTILQDVNGFTRGVRSVNPEAEVRVVWTNSWHDPAGAREAAVSLIDVGADVIAHAQDSPAAVQAAEERGVLGVGYHNDQREFAPDTIITSPTWNWTPFYVEQAKAVLDGTWEGHSWWKGIQSGVFDIAPFEEFVPQDVRERVQEVKSRMMEGEDPVFKGPLFDQQGNELVPEGETLSDGQIQEMDFLVDGVKGNLPN